MKKYTVAYKQYKYGMVEEITVTAKSKAEAWAAVAMKPIDGEFVYSAWVISVQYTNGRVQYFNTSEGNAY